MNIEMLTGDRAFVLHDGAYKMSSVAYHADPCPLPSFTQSIAKILLEYSPRHAWHAHPRLNPNYQEDTDKKFDIGNVAHRLWLGAGKDYEIFEYDDWNASGAGVGGKKALHAARDVAREAGKVPILAHQFERATHMARCAVEQGAQAHIGEGHQELVLAWEENGIWLRTMVDSVSLDLREVVDFKTTDHCVAPHVIGRLMANAGWDVQAAMFERGLDRIDPQNAGRRKFYFIAQEAFEPYCLTEQTMPESALTIGRKKIDFALNIWRSCITRGEWPGYQPAAVSEPLPDWAEIAWLKREIVADDRERSGLLVGGLPITAAG